MVGGAAGNERLEYGERVWYNTRNRLLKLQDYQRRPGNGDGRKPGTSEHDDR